MNPRFSEPASRTRMRPGGAALGLLLALPLASALATRAAPGEAQWHGATDGVVLPASSTILQDDAISAELNPALLGYLQAFSLAYVHAEVDRRGEWLGRGDAVHVATPLWFDFSAGLSLHSLRAGPRALRPLGNRSDRALAAFSLAYAPSDAFSVGLTARGVSSGNPQLDGLAAFDLGMSLRPSPLLGLSLVGRDLFLSREGLGTRGLALGSTLELGVQLRPFGVDDLVLDTALATGLGKRVAGRAGLALRIPLLGHAAAFAEVERIADADAAVRIMAELSVNYGQTTLALAGMAGDGFDRDRIDWVGMARIEAMQRRGLPVGGQVLDVELESLSPRRMLALAALLERARHDARIAGVLLRPRGSGMGTAYAQEIRAQIRALQATGKPVACHMDSASTAEYYACSAADELLMDPAGSIRFIGGAARLLFLGGTLDKLGVRADFVRIGPYKSAPEQFTERRMTDPAREQLSGLMDDVQERLLGDIAADMNTSRDRVHTLMDEGPYLAIEAQQAGMVAGVLDELRIAELGVAELGPRPLVQQMPAERRPYMATPARIGVVLVDGAIVDGDSVDVPFLGVHMSGARTVVHALEGLAADPTVRAIVLRVDSPGGSVLASDQIWRAVERARRRKPVIASMGAVAASGGYYVASAADEIWADPSTITGSIGIYFGKVDISPLAERLGVSVEFMQRGKRAGGDSMWRPFTGDERAALAERLRRFYRMFLARVKAGRGMELERIDALGRGRVFSGDAAREVGLVDHLGGFASALRKARSLAGLQVDAPLVVLPEPPGGLLEMAMGQLGASVEASEIPEPFRQLAGTFSLLHLLDGRQPMALLPYDLTL